MPITPTTSTQTTAFKKSNNHIFTPTNNSGNSRTTNLNCQAPTAIDIVHTSSDPAHEIEEISKKISEHAEVLYRNWKSRGLAPTELLEFYANAATTITPTTATAIQGPIITKKGPTDSEVLIATNDFLANLASNGKTDAITTAGLQQLVNTFVLKDKEQRAGNAMTGKTATKTPTTTKTSSAKPVKSAILLKEEEATSLAPAKVVLKKTIKTASEPLITTTTTSVTATTSGKSATILKTPKNAISTNNFLKNKIGNNIILQQQPQQPTTKSATAVKLKKSTIKTTTTPTSSSAMATTTPIPTSTPTPTPTNVDMNLNMELNLHINDMEHLSQFQNDNLLKIKELLQDQSTAMQNVKNTNLTSGSKTIKTPTNYSRDEQKSKKLNRLVVVNNERVTTESAEKNCGVESDDDNNIICIDGVSLVDGKRSGDNNKNATTTTTTKTKTTKINKLNKNQTLLIDQIDNATDKTAIVTNTKKIKTRQTKTTSTPATIATNSTSSTGTAQSVTMTSASKETNGNSSDVSVISDSSRTKNRTKITKTTPTTTTTAATTNNNKETKEKLSINNNNNNNKNITSDNNNKKVEDQEQQQNNNNNNNMALVRSSSTSSMPTGNAKMKMGRSNSLTNGTDKNMTSRPFLTRGSVAERVMMFEKCPDVRNSFLNIKRPDPAEAPPKSLLKVNVNCKLLEFLNFVNLFNCSKFICSINGYLTNGRMPFYKQHI